MRYNKLILYKETFKQFDFQCLCDIFIFRKSISDRYFAADYSTKHLKPAALIYDHMVVYTYALCLRTCMWRNIRGVKYLRIRQIGVHSPKFNLPKFCLQNILINYGAGMLLII